MSLLVKRKKESWRELLTESELVGFQKKESVERKKWKQWYDGSREWNRLRKQYGAKGEGKKTQKTKK